MARRYTSMIARDASAEVINGAERLIREHGKITLTPKGDRDLVTDVDMTIESFARVSLQQFTPEWGFLGEETGHVGSGLIYWCLDPVDGTVNFSRAIPHFSVALALIENDQPIQGEVLVPQHRERYYAAKGCNLPYHASEVTKLADSVVGLGDFSTGIQGLRVLPRQLRWTAQLASKVCRVRMQGSASVDLCWLAKGRLDAVVASSNKPWDMAAGVAIARAAGAIVTHTDGSPYSIGGPDILAAAPGIHEQLVELLASA